MIRGTKQAISQPAWDEVRANHMSGDSVESAIETVI